ncbi:MAG: hypothetical protein KBB88_00155 [Candidatus Pacebacteria bacterium]|nr:hypothetical protein [Candidatus Paceibacterota bacterium]
MLVEKKQKKATFREIHSAISKIETPRIILEGEISYYAIPGVKTINVDSKIKKKIPIDLLTPIA